MTADGQPISTLEHKLARSHELDRRVIILLERLEVADRHTPIGFFHKDIIELLANMRSF